LVFLLAVTVLSCVWYLYSSRGSSDWPGGYSPPGLVFGVVGGLLILFEFALWGRKKVRAWRIGRVQTWMIAHIWLGLLTVPLLILHSGFRWGGSLSAVLMVLFLVVIASGVWGLILQQYLPTRMLNQVPAETIHSQIDRMVRFMIEDAQRLVHATCGPAPGEESLEADPEDVEQGAPISHLTVPGSEPLREIFRASIAPYLKEGRRSRSPLALPNKAEAIFRELRNKLNPGTYEAIDILENLCDQRRQLDRQDRLHRWLHNWLWVHLPLSIALVVLMFFHVWVAFKYR